MCTVCVHVRTYVVALMTAAQYRTRKVDGHGPIVVTDIHADLFNRKFLKKHFIFLC